MYPRVRNRALLQGMTGLFQRVEQGGKVVEAFPMLVDEFEQAVAGPAGQGRVGQGQHGFAFRHPQAFDSPAFPCPFQREGLLPEHPAPVQLFQQGDKALVPPVLVAILPPIWQEPSAPRLTG